MIALGLFEIHKDDMIHRDITPHNIFIDKKGTLKIGDFGVSKYQQNTKPVSLIYGRIGYISPE